MEHNVLMLGGWADNAFGMFRQLESVPNINIFCADAAEDSCVKYFKSCKKSFKLPPYENPDSCVDAIFDICKKENIDVLLPTLEPSMFMISKHKKRFLTEGINLSIPDHDILVKSSDKLKLYKHAKKHNIDQPKTYVLSDTSLNEIFNENNFPLIIKLKISTGQRGLGFVYNKSECKNHIDKLLTKYSEEEIIIQEHIPGLPLETMYTTGLLYDRKHNLKLVVPTKKIREYPFLPGGSGICVKTEKNKDVSDFCVKLINSFGKWEGIADVETKIDPRDGKVKLIEINPRAWGIHYVLYTAGVNLADYWIKTALDQDFDFVSDFKDGAYANTFSRDILLFSSLIGSLFGKKRKAAIKVLKSYKYPYLVKNHKYPMSTDLKLKEPIPCLRNIWRLRKEIVKAPIPEFVMKREVKI